MRNKILAMVALVATIATPVSAIAEPTAKTEIDESKVVEAIKASVDPYTLPTKEETAAKQINENLKKIEEERKAAETAEAARVAAEAAKRAAFRPVIVVSAPVDLQALYNAAGARFGVNPAILAAVHFVETGQRQDTTVSSYAGAQGPMQFMPSTFRAYAVDGDGDGITNIYDVHDAVFTAARYLASNGAASGNVTGALFCYNHSTAYVNHVLAVARGFGYNG